MNKQIPLKPLQIDKSKIIYRKKNVSDNKTVINIKYNDNGIIKPLVFQTCTLFNKIKPKKFNNYWEFNIPLCGKVDKKVDALRDFLNEIDKKVLDDAKVNRDEWFNNIKKIKFRELINKSDTNDKIWKNGSISFKIPIKSNSIFQTTLLRNNKTKMNIEEIEDDTMIKMVLEIYAVIIREDYFYVYIRPVVLSFSEFKNTYNYKLIDSNSDSNEIEQEREIIDTEVLNSLFIKATDILKDEEDSTVLDVPSNIRLNKKQNLNEILEIDTSMFSASSGKNNYLNISTVSEETPEIKINNLYLNE